MTFGKSSDGLTRQDSKSSFSPASSERKLPLIPLEEPLIRSSSYIFKSNSREELNILRKREDAFVNDAIKANHSKQRLYH